MIEIIIIILILNNKTNKNLDYILIFYIYYIYTVGGKLFELNWTPLLGPEHRWCEDPIGIAPFIIVIVFLCI